MTEKKQANITVVGIGGGGVNSLINALKNNIKGVDSFCLNTDKQDLKKASMCPEENRIAIGENLTQGLGAGSNSEKGRDAALESEEKIREILVNTDMLFIAAGMGGGTGTGASPVVAKIAKDMGILTVAVVTMPFSFEGKQRKMVAEQGVAELEKNVDTMIIVKNDNLLKVSDKKMTLVDSYELANGVLYDAVSGVTDLVLDDGLQNVDFADVKTVMLSKGLSIMTTGYGEGENRAHDAITKALTSPLLDDIKIEDANGVIVNIISGGDFQIDELEVIGNAIDKITSDTAISKIGTSINMDLDDSVKVTVIATGLKGKSQHQSNNSPLSLINNHKIQSETETQIITNKEEPPQSDHSTVNRSFDNQTNKEPIEQAKKGPPTFIKVRSKK